MSSNTPSGSAPEPAASTIEAAPSGDRSASSPTWLPLEDGEQVRWADGPRIQTVLPWVALALVGITVLPAAVALEVLPLLSLAGIPVVVTPALWQYARVSRTAFVVTNAVAATRHGVLGRTVRTVSLERIQNTTVEQHPIGRFVGYGTVTIETAGGSAIEFWNVEEPSQIRDALEAERERLTGEEVPGRRDQWEAVLDEVREWRRVLERNP